MKASISGISNAPKLLATTATAGRDANVRLTSTAVIQLFSTLVYQSMVGLPSLRRRLCRDIRREANILRDVDADGAAWSRENYRGGFTTYGSLSQLHQQFPVFQELESAVDRHVARFAKAQHWDLQGGRLKMVSAWVNLMGPGTVHSSHLHPLAVVSGSFYVSLPRGTSPIKFEDPRLDRFMAQPPRQSRAPRSQQTFVSLSPKVGEVILFESWLRHEVPPVPAGTGERLSVSFNYDWV